jgi:very-short-patch-repair endonuclease
MNKLLNINELINRFNDIHNNQYCYSEIKYTGIRNKIVVKCSIHGNFRVTPKNHLRGQGCSHCDNLNKNKKRKLSHNDFIVKAKKKHSNFYDYSLVHFNKTSEKINIICSIHGNFNQRVSNHLNGQGCPKCAANRISKIKKSNTEKFIEKSNYIHDNYYSYNESIYIDNITYLTITCPIHGNFKQKPKEHLRGKGCVKCGVNVSKSEKDIIEFIKLLNIDHIENNRNILNGKEIDIYIPDHKLGIEFDGIYWHSNLFLNKNYHRDKTELCEKQGIQLIHVFENEWINKKEIVKSIIKSKLGIIDSEIFAKKCEVREINDGKLIMDFLETNHIQGFVESKYKIGLFHDDELMSLMTFDNKRTVNDEYEMLRFCNKLNTTVIGGASKLLSYFIKIYEPKSILTFVDRRYSDGNFYKQLGFKYLGNTEPNYWYFKNNELKQYHRFGFRKDVLVKEGHDPNKTEKQIMRERGYLRIYDSGNIKLEKINTNLIID